MASIDKTYVTWEEYQNLVKYFDKKLRRRMKKDLGYIINIPKYSLESFENESGERMLWNTSSIEDLWIAKNIKLNFIQKRLKEQYSENWVGFLVDLDFRSVGWILGIISNNESVQPYKTKTSRSGAFSVKPFYRLLHYGTSHFNKLLYYSLQLIGGEKPYGCEDNIEIDVELFGSFFNIKYENGIVRVIHVCYSFDGDDSISKEVDWFYHPIVDEYLNKKSKRNTFFKFLPRYNVNSNPRIRKMKYYQPEQIIFSKNDNSFDMGNYKNYNKKYKKRYFDMSVSHNNQLETVPNYIKAFIK